ncbi:unnamed protein product [Rotaria sp. Silwood2]|nr:unnamed protein product [Rotaria sp. Silwood2]
MKNNYCSCTCNTFNCLTNKNISNNNYYYSGYNSIHPIDKPLTNVDCNILNQHNGMVFRLKKLNNICQSIFIGNMNNQYGYNRRECCSCFGNYYQNMYNRQDRINNIYAIVIVENIGHTCCTCRREKKPLKIRKIIPNSVFIKDEDEECYHIECALRFGPWTSLDWSNVSERKKRNFYNNLNSKLILKKLLKRNMIIFVSSYC